MLFYTAEVINKSYNSQAKQNASKIAFCKLISVKSVSGGRNSVESVEPKPVPTGPKRPRGRPRKWPPPDTSLPKRSRGRPRKNANPTLELPTMVGMAADTTLQNNRPPVVTAPIATDVVPPDDLFNNDDVD